MSDELRRALRSATPRPSELDVDRVRDRATAIRRHRRAGQLSLLGAGLAAAVLVVGTLLPTDGQVIVEPGPTPTATPSPSPSPRDEGQARAGPCEDDRQLVAEWLPEGFSSRLLPGMASGPAEGVWHWDGGQGRSIEVHVDVRPYALAPEAASDAVLFGRRAVIGPVHEATMLAWPDVDPPDPQDVCGIAAVVGHGIEERELFGVSEGLRLRDPAAAASVRVRDAELLDSGSGWATGTEGILRTLDGGSRWWLASPKGADPLRLRGTWFLDHANGWTLEMPADDQAEDGGGRARLWRTVDAGATWDASEIDLPSPPFGSYGPVEIDFVDPDHGWLLASFGRNATADQGGALFATDDGGRSWQPLDRPPASAAMEVTTPTVGWVAGGPTGGPTSLHVTRDGGARWQEVQVPLPAGWEAASPTHGAPAFWTVDTGALPVVLRGGRDAAALAVYTTADEGRSWTFDDLTEVPATSYGPGGPVAFDLTGPNGWVFAAPDGSRIRMRNQFEARDLDYPGGPLPGPVADVSAPDHNRVWALVLPEDQGCAVGWDICLGLHLPINGRWQPARPTAGPPPSGCAADASGRNATSDDDPATLDIYFTCEEDQVSFPAAVYRITRAAPEEADTPAELLRATLEAWLVGPDDSERDRGYVPALPTDQSEFLAGVTVDSSGVATVDFTSALTQVNNLNTSHASMVFNRQLLAAVFSTPGVEAARFTIERDCEAYSGYFQSSGCPLHRPAGQAPPIGDGA